MAHIAEADRRRAESLPAAIVLVALSALAPLTVDMFLPSLPTMTEEFGATRSTMQLAVLLFILAFASSQLVYGPLSDRAGRRPALLAGLALFVAGGLIALAARTPEVLIAGRVVQGLGGGAGPALAQAMVLDVYGRERAARVLAYMAVALPLAPAIAPIFGGFLHDIAGWQSVFVTLSVLGVVLAGAYLALLPETNPAARRAARGNTSVLRDYVTALSSPTFVTYAVVMGLMFTGQLLFISTSAFVLIEEVGLGEQAYGFSFAFVAAGIMVGAWLSSRLVTRLAARHTVLLGATAATSAAAVMFVLTWFFLPTVPGLLVPMFFVGMGLGVTRPAAVAAAMVEFPQMAGLASAVLGFTQMLVASGANIVYGRLTEPSSVALAGGVAAAMVAGLLAVLLLQLTPVHTPGLAHPLPTRPAPALDEEAPPAPNPGESAAEVGTRALARRNDTRVRRQRPSRRAVRGANGDIALLVDDLTADADLEADRGASRGADADDDRDEQRLARPGAALLIAIVSILLGIRLLLRYGRGRRIGRD